MQVKFEHKYSLSKLFRPLFTKAVLLFFVLLFSLLSCKKTEMEDSLIPGIALYNDVDNKLWRHRVNEIDKVNEYLESFPGIELDVYYNFFKNKFYVAHDDDYDLDDSETLNGYFSAIENVEAYYYWIDFKNLNSTNDKKSLKRMLEIFDNFDIKNNAIVESPYHKFLTKFNEEGIYTSYWVPVHDYNGELNEENENDVVEISDNLKECRHNALSSHANNIKFLTEYFPDYNIHLWTNGLISEADMEIINEIKEYPNVKVILVDYESAF